MDSIMIESNIRKTGRLERAIIFQYAAVRTVNTVMNARQRSVPGQLL